MTYQERIDNIRRKIQQILDAASNTDMDWSPGMERYMAGQVNGLRQALSLLVTDKIILNERENQGAAIDA